MAGGSRGIVALEFYSGIGALHYSLQRARPSAAVAACFDLNEVANAVYEHNFGLKPITGNIESKATPKMLDKYAADLWMLSPPCQPYTRQGLKRDGDDGRARSFLKLLDLMPDLKHPPTYILVENVVGFETSRTHGSLLEALEHADFAVQQFLLSPLQMGVPYSRPRYFCLAKRRPKAFPRPEWDGRVITSPP
eukprot:CAMPEP_0182898590 /NCGR_PEP_ID=MMETSP0034_2-20130328/27577_1 /TAXON_ID=156128 /ORGANISM="Nephroselmis pyriformis, Strain CCMP717" /LENGTH=192 /DNA_ID=CAMNT_0025032571 /DNA_START=86 /DNA_END=660 /DNA_ORIENTATION=+